MSKPEMTDESLEDIYDGDEGDYEGDESDAVEEDEETHPPIYSQEEIQQVMLDHAYLVD